MKDVEKNRFARLVPMSMSRLRAYTYKYREELAKLRQEGNSLNYKAVLFLCWKIVIDPKEIYPDESKELLNEEQKQILSDLYGTNPTNW